MGVARSFVLKGIEMAKGGKHAEEAAQLCRPLIEGLGLHLVDVDFVKEGKNQVLRIFIDKRGGVGLDDCADSSRAVSPVLDGKFSWTGPYLLELSSPGLDRPLKTLQDLERHLNEELDVRLYRPYEGKKEVRGILMGADADKIVLNPTDCAGQTTDQCFVLPLTECAKISRHIRF